MAPTVGIVSPGAMGSALADALESRVVATLEARSERTRGLAAQAERLELLPTFGDVLREADVVLSVVPPGEAEEIGSAIRQAGARFLFVDLNAVSPETVRRIGADVDGAISGPPPWRPDTTRIYLSGPRAAEVESLPWTRVELVVVGEEVGTASAVKMCTASVYKGTTALLAHALLTARSAGVLEHVLDDLRSSFPELIDGAGTAVARATTKSARYVPEMREIAETQAGAGLPRELFDGVAAAYEALSKRELARMAPEDIRAGLDVAKALDQLRS
jgi:3-hydroxyisobutyrate dehydrogenase-like beta-hydroxyacid dehydrogenase